MNRIASLGLTALFLLAGCAADGAGGPSTGNGDKTALFQGGKFDSSLEARVCREAGLPEGCDVCDAKGYYGDGECDSFCQQPDSDCSETCNTDADCPTIFCITTPCPQFACRNGACTQNTGCEPQDAAGTGQCEAYFGYYWNGSACVGYSGCQCEGADCGNAFGSVEECAAAHTACIDSDPCAAQDARGTGLCKAIVGVFWNGYECHYSSGCRCEGADCGNGYLDIATCEAEHTACTQADDCVVGGCSGQLCNEASLGPIASTCEWTAAYACYQGATCERQADGACGWTHDATLDACLDAADTVVCPTLSPPSPNFCGEGGPAPTPITDENNCVIGYECATTTDCRTDGCGTGSKCDWCWGNYACIPNGALC